MSNDVFPDLPGLSWGVIKSPVWATKILTTSSGRELRGQFQSYPRWKFTLKYEFLRERGGRDELRQLCGFFNQRGGSFENFLFRDPEDYTVENQALGFGDGTRLEYRFVRDYGGFVEPVLAPGDAWVYIDRGSPGKWRVSETARVARYGRTDDITSAYWANLGVTLSANVANDPDGELRADRITEDTATGSHRISKSTTPVDGALICFSWRVKPETRNVVCINSAGLAGGGRIDFDLTGAGEATVVSGTPLGYGVRALANGWYRVWQVFRSLSPSAGTVSFNILPSVGSSVSYTGNGTGSILHGGLGYEVLPEGAPLEPTEYMLNQTGGALTIPAEWSRGDYGYFSFVNPVPAGQEITWSGTFYYRVRFTHDAAEFERFYQQLYSAKKIEFISEK